MVLRGANAWRRLPLGRVPSVVSLTELMRIIPMLRSFVREEAGASLLEYGLLVALIAVVCIAAIRVLGTRIRDVFERVVNELNNV